MTRRGWTALGFTRERMPWEDQDADWLDEALFVELSQQHGTAFALRVWRYLSELIEFTDALIGDDVPIDVAQEAVRQWGERLAEREGRDMVLLFWAAYRRLMIQGEGVTRRLRWRAAERAAQHAADVKPTLRIIP